MAHLRFLVGSNRAKGTPLQRRNYTLTLKAAIAGMTAVVPEGSKGVQLDALVRMHAYPLSAPLALEVIDAGYCLDAPEHLPDGAHVNLAAGRAGSTRCRRADVFAR